MWTGIGGVEEGVGRRDRSRGVGRRDRSRGLEEGVGRRDRRTTRTISWVKG